MVPLAFRDFFGPEVGASAALVGLLFIAVSVAPDRGRRDESAVIEQARSTSALTAFLNPLIISLVALLPAARLGIPAIVVGIAGLLFVAGTLRRYFTVSRSNRENPRGLLSLAGFTAVSVVMVVYGIESILDPHSSSPIGAIAAATIASLLIGVDRAWALLGGRGRGRYAQLKDIVRPGDDIAKPGDE